MTGTGEVIRQLAEADDTNAQMQRDLFVSYCRVADLMEKQKHAMAIENWRSAHDFLAGMVERGLHVSPRDMDIL